LLDLIVFHQIDLGFVLIMEGQNLILRD